MWRPISLLLCVALASAVDFKALREELMADEGLMDAKNECLKSLSITLEDLQSDKKPDEMPEKILCFMKCVQEKQGLLDEQGMLVPEKYTSLPIFAHLDEDKTQKTMDCLKGLDKIETCQDVNTIKDCFHKNF